MHSSGTKLSLGQAVDAWRVQRATLSTAPLSGMLDLGSFLLNIVKGV